MKELQYYATVMVSCSSTGPMELKQDNELALWISFIISLSLTAYSMGPSKGKEILGEKYKEGIREDTEGLCKNKYNYKSQLKNTNSILN